ncbi:radial spoke head 1 homolog isoform X3 [Girardinichthys multiradiatus]|uniref:radial spoke head 1 homolog isoform X3 n=1 Tax=Girardinichthys multiradiatus TaxID=208333 RepID=UPI001FAD4BD8|nr:radial spoke head 1 homolog isoform X3 [Girardinichthys multiradiatus]
MSDRSSEDEEHTKLGSYEGERNEAGERHGVGKALLPNGDTYQGGYKNGKRHGHQGTYCFKNGARYDGEYSQNKKHGQGTFYYPDRSKYEGGTNLLHKTLRISIMHHWILGRGPERRPGCLHLPQWRHIQWRMAVPLEPHGPGKYVFDIGCEQYGEYRKQEQEQGEDTLAVDGDLKWIPMSITSLTSKGPVKEN